MTTHVQIKGHQHMFRDVGSKGIILRDVRERDNYNHRVTLMRDLDKQKSEINTLKEELAELKQMFLNSKA